MNWTEVPVHCLNKTNEKLNYRVNDYYELYDYQKNIYNQMLIAMGKNEIKMDSSLFGFQKPHQILTVQFKSNIGILGTPVGSGKTWLILYMLKNYEFTDILNLKTNDMTVNCSSNMYNIKYKTPYLDISLIIVSNNQMVNQWKEEASTFFNLELKSLNHNNVKEEINNIYITTFSYLKTSKFDNIFIKFLIIDELNFSFLNHLNAKFTWILSADAKHIINTTFFEKKHYNSNLGQLGKFLNFLKNYSGDSQLPFLITCNQTFEQYVDMKFNIHFNYLNIHNMNNYDFDGTKMIVLNDYFFTRCDNDFLDFKNYVLNFFILKFNNFKFVDKDFLNVKFDNHELVIVKQSLINNGLNFHSIRHVIFFPFINDNFEVVVNQLVHRFIRIRRKGDLHIWQFTNNNLFKDHLTIEFIKN